MTPKGLLREPLLHFLLAGLLLFIVYDQLAEDDDAANYLSDRIVVDEAALVRFIEYRSKNFAADRAYKRLQEAPAEERQALIDEYVREEAQYRVALRFGLDQDDYVIRRRLVQKMDVLAEGVGRTDEPAALNELEPFFARNSERYLQGARITFTHVFFRAQSRSGAALMELASKTLAELNQSGVPFADAPEYGERFPYQLNYVERPYDEVAAHFGLAAAEKLFALGADAGRWVGPIVSDHGVHLVLVSAYQGEYAPELAEVADQVRADYQAERATGLRTLFARQLVEQFEVEVDPQLSQGL